MRSSYLISLILVLILAGTYWYQATAYVCPIPLSYRIGELDEDFNISRETAISYVEKAESYWEEATSRELFTYDESADFTVNYVFDARQENANDQTEARAELDAKWEESEEVKNVIDSLQRDYDDLASSHEAHVADYESRLTEYNQQVNRYNDRGGAPSDIFAELEEERSELNNLSDDLNRTASRLNLLGEEINELAERGNQLVENYNQEVKTYNRKYGHSGEFTQGDYQGDKINIYKFSTDNEVITVLAHELGHALGIDHIEDKDSLMYYLLEDPDSEPVITAADLTEFYAVCGASDDMSDRIRRTIRDLLEIF